MSLLVAIVIMLAIVAGVTAVHYLIIAAYNAGVCDGYQFSREPWNPTLRKPAKVLHQLMGYRFKDIPEVPPI